MCETFERDYTVYEEWTGRTFKSNLNKLSAASNQANAHLLQEGDMTLNEFYSYFGLDDVRAGQDIGWSGERVELIYGTLMSEKGEPMIALSFRNEPTSGWVSRS